MSVGTRHIAAHGHSVVLQTYEEGGKDDYGDATLTAVPSTVTAIRELRTGSADAQRDASGAIPVGEAIFYVKDTITVGTVTSTISVYDGAATHASELVDSGSTYAAIQVDDLGNGVIVVVAERNRA